MDVGDEADGAAVSLAAETQRAGFHYTTTLKKECPTRWNSLLTMLESLLKIRQLVESCLASLRLFEKIPSIEDWQSPVLVQHDLEILFNVD
jgi:hypothetical protein